MLDFRPMAGAPAYVIDALNGLLDAEANSVFRFIDDASTYLSRATAEVRQPLVEMGQLSNRNAQDLADLIDSLGGLPMPQRSLRIADQYLSYLSLKFLLPKLVTETQLLLRRYENARRTIGNDFPVVLAVLNRIMAEQQRYLDILLKAAHEVTGGRFTPGADPSGPVHAGEKQSDGGPSVD